MIVENEFGSIRFIGKTDVTSVDFADVVTIKQGLAEVYDDERHGSSKPAVGSKLNKPAIITLMNIKPKAGQNTVDKENRLRKNIEMGDGEHIKYDGSVWQFKVKHFTKYGDIDEESDEEMPNQDNQNNSFEVEIQESESSQFEQQSVK